MKFSVSFLFIYFRLTQTNANESRVIVQLVKLHQHNNEDGWTKCLIVTMGLSPLLQKVLESIHLFCLIHSFGILRAVP